MKIQEPSPQTIALAVQGQLAAIDEIIEQVQPGIFNLAVRMLGNRDDAADATQEILLKVITHLSEFRATAAFSTWVYRVAKNHLLTALTRSRESPEISLEALGDSLGQGLLFNQTLASPYGEHRVLQPEEKLEAKQIALGCTQKMLMSLDREQRLSYILDTVFGLSSTEAAAVLEVSADAHRQRLSRARSRLNRFAGTFCGLASETAACQCEKQIPAVRHLAAAPGAAPRPLVAIHPTEQAELLGNFEALVRLGDASALIKAHPAYRSPDRMRQAIRAVLSAEGFFSARKPLQ
ncbi:MAG: RNA polymerase sigma factor [Curvibacter sp.]|jgi:RNA polymerase sigma factor (sigma-70 family)|nr:RNA polymerase sigma factor [Curvibacter sp.]